MPWIRFASVVGQGLYVDSITAGAFTCQDFPLTVTLHRFAYISHKVASSGCNFVLPGWNCGFAGRTRVKTGLQPLCLPLFDGGRQVEK